MKLWLIAAGVMVAAFLAMGQSEAFIDASLYSVTLDVGKKDVHETILVEFKTTAETQIELRLTADPKNMVALVDGKTGQCNIQNEIGSSKLTCDLETAGNHKISAEYDTAYSLVHIDSTSIVRHNFLPLFNSDVFVITLKLPNGVIIQNLDQDVVPKSDEVSSDGKRIILKWSRASLTEPFGISVLFGDLPRGAVIWYLVGISTLIAIILVTAFWKKIYRLFMMTFAKLPESGENPVPNQRELVYPDLLESEQKVVEALKSNLNVLKQKELVRITAFSKAKMSRLLKQMEARKIIYSKPYGNSKKIYLISGKNKNAGEK